MFVDIDEPSLSLHPSFVEAVRVIDNARTESESSSAMDSFISKFGTHFALTTVMGVGVNFETRYTEEETLNHSDQTLNECSSRSGGFQLFGFGSHSSTTDCEGSLNDTTSGKIEYYLFDVHNHALIWIYRF